MSTTSFTESEIAAKLVEGCLAHIAGDVSGEMPIVPVPISELQRADAGLAQGGKALLYPVSKDGGVFLDLNGSLATIWFVNGDFQRGLAALDRMLKATGRRVKQLKDEPRDAPKNRVRSYEVDCGGDGRLAHVVVEYAEAGARPERFFVRVSAQVRKK
ncbi:MAG: hypothetical protein KF779_00905 [Hyphomonadaceae bacterium]|nr:hypothetical protein [Hyphomonadaceae bacterium]